jgi:allantoinase
MLDAPMEPYDLVVRGRRVVLPDAERPAAVAIRDGKVAAIEPFDARIEARATLDAEGATVLPGLVDTHVHVNDPGRAEWEGWESATRAAAAGGVTTIVDMPLNAVPPTTSVAALETKLEAARGRAWVDYGLWGGVVPGNEAALAPLVEAGALGFKAFLAPSGVDEFPHVDEEELARAAPILRETGVPLLVHAEDPAALDSAALARSPAAYTAWLASRPPRAEAEAIERLGRLAAESGAWVHVVHVAAAQAVEALARARASGARLTGETCPHYLFFAAETIPPESILHKCAPPIREEAHRERLWRALAEGVLDLVASDHSPCPAAMKAGDFATAWGGIASLQLSLSALWRVARERGHRAADIARWTSAAPARLAGLDDRKGAIAPGLDADLVVWDPDLEWTPRADEILHRHAATPYLGAKLRGRVKRTILRGRLVYDDGTFLGEPRGWWLRGRGDGA